MSLASYFVLSSARLMPPRSTARVHDLEDGSGDEPSHHEDHDECDGPRDEEQHRPPEVGQGGTDVGLPDREGFLHDVPPVA
jgi:hypothetical protein